MNEFLKEEYLKCKAKCGENENTYYQCGCLISPELQIQMGEEWIVTDEYKDAYDTLTSNDPEDVIECWKEFGLYQSDIFTNYELNDKFVLEEDGEGVYLLMRINDLNDLENYLNHCII